MPRRSSRQGGSTKRKELDDIILAPEPEPGPESEPPLKRAKLEGGAAVKGASKAEGSVGGENAGASSNGAAKKKQKKLSMADIDMRMSHLSDDEWDEDTAELDELLGGRKRKKKRQSRADDSGNAGKGKQRTMFASEVATMMYGAGDERQPNPEAVRLVDSAVQEFIVEMCHAAVREVACHRGTRKKVDESDVLFLIRNDPTKFQRAVYLLRLNKDVKQIKNAWKLRTRFSDDEDELLFS